MYTINQKLYFSVFAIIGSSVRVYDLLIDDGLSTHTCKHTTHTYTHTHTHLHTHTHTHALTHSYTKSILVSMKSFGL